MRVRHIGRTKVAAPSRGRWQSVHEEANRTPVPRSYRSITTVNQPLELLENVRSSGQLVAGGEVASAAGLPGCSKLSAGLVA
jgi:hypothetical protein